MQGSCELKTQYLYNFGRFDGKEQVLFTMDLLYPKMLNNNYHTDVACGLHPEADFKTHYTYFGVVFKGARDWDGNRSLRMEK